jgi:hypothetical protein
LRRDLGVGKAEDGDGGSGLLESIFEVALVEDVSFGVLDYKEDAAFVKGLGFGVGFKCGTETGC